MLHYIPASLDHWDVGIVHELMGTVVQQWEHAFGQTLSESAWNRREANMALWTGTRFRLWSEHTLFCRITRSLVCIRPLHPLSNEWWCTPQVKWSQRDCAQLLLFWLLGQFTAQLRPPQTLQTFIGPPFNDEEEVQTLINCKAKLAHLSCPCNYKQSWTLACCWNQ